MGLLDIDEYEYSLEVTRINGICEGARTIQENDHNKVDNPEEIARRLTASGHLGIVYPDEVSMQQNILATERVKTGSNNLTKRRAGLKRVT